MELKPDLEYLAHYGVKGMKWGVRKDRRASNYSDAQRKRDERIYGKRAVKRINRRMLKGESIQSARHNEVVAKKDKQAAKIVTKNIAKTIVTVGGGIAVASYIHKKGWDETLMGAVLQQNATVVGKQFINVLLK